MKKLLTFLATMFVVATVYPQVGLGLGYNMGTEGQGFSLDFEFMSGSSQLGFEGDFLSKDDKFEVTVHGGPRFMIGEKMTISPLMEMGWRSPKSPIIGGSLVWMYNPYNPICLFAKIQYGAAVSIEEKHVSFLSGVKVVAGIAVINFF